MIASKDDLQRCRQADLEAHGLERRTARRLLSAQGRDRRDAAGAPVLGDGCSIGPGVPAQKVSERTSRADIH